MKKQKKQRKTEEEMIAEWLEHNKPSVVIDESIPIPHLPSNNSLCK